MALQITTKLQTTTGIEVATSYGRIASSDQQQGTTISPTLWIYSSKATFEAGARELNVINPATGLPLSIGYSFPYNRQTDGVDTLGLSHTRIQAALAADGITSTIDLS